MTTWHHVRRIVAAVIAGVLASVLQQQGYSFTMSVGGGIAAAVIFGGVLFPLLWRPPASNVPRRR